jgi:hypothetical protein
MNSINLAPVLSIANLLYDYTSASEGYYISTAAIYMSSSSETPAEFSLSDLCSRSSSWEESSSLSSGG